MLESGYSFEFVLSKSGRFFKFLFYKSGLSLDRMWKLWSRKEFSPNGKLKSVGLGLAKSSNAFIFLEENCTGVSEALGAFWSCRDAPGGAQRFQGGLEKVFERQGASLRREWLSSQKPSKAPKPY